MGREHVAALGVGDLVGEGLHRGRAADEHVTKRFGAGLGIVECLDGLGHVRRVVGHGVHDRHGFLATGGRGDRLGVVRVLLGVPLHQRFVIAAFTRAQRAGAGFGGQDVVDAVAVVATGHHRNGERAIGMPDDVHAGPYPFHDRLTRGMGFER